MFIVENIDLFKGKTIDQVLRGWQKDQQNRIRNRKHYHRPTQRSKSYGKTYTVTTRLNNK